MMLIMINPDRKMTSEMISESTGANPVLIRQIFGKLKTAGLLQISTGRGITKLAKAPDEINLWDVYTAVEGDHADELFTFHQNISKECRVGCSFKEIFESPCRQSPPGDEGRTVGRVLGAAPAGMGRNQINPAVYKRPPLGGRKRRPPP